MSKDKPYVDKQGYDGDKGASDNEVMQGEII